MLNQAIPTDKVPSNTKHSIRQMLLFAGAGAAGFVADVLVLYAAIALGSGYYLGRAVSFTCAATVTWLINRKYTFDAAPSRSLVGEWTKYVLAMIGGGIINYSCYAVVVFYMPGRPLSGFAGVFAGSLAGMFANYFVSKNVIFKPKVSE